MTAPRRRCTRERERRPTGTGGRAAAGLTAAGRATGRSWSRGRTRSCWATGSPRLAPSRPGSARCEPSQDAGARCADCGVCGVRGAARVDGSCSACNTEAARRPCGQTTAPGLSAICSLACSTPPGLRHSAPPQVLVGGSAAAPRMSRLARLDGCAPWTGLGRPSGAMHSCGAPSRPVSPRIPSPPLPSSSPFGGATPFRGAHAPIPLRCWGRVGRGHAPGSGPGSWRRPGSCARRPARPPPGGAARSGTGRGCCSPLRRGARPVPQTSCASRSGGRERAAGARRAPRRRSPPAGSSTRARSGHASLAYLTPSAPGQGPGASCAPLREPARRCRPGGARPPPRPLRPPRRRAQRSTRVFSAWVAH